MNKYFLVVICGLLFYSCTMATAKRHTGATPQDQGCGHCHFLIYKDWKISYKPYEQVPVPGSTIAPGQFPQYHDRREKVVQPETTVLPAKKDCGGCHVKAETAEGTCTREKSGYK